MSFWDDLTGQNTPKAQNYTDLANQTAAASQSATNAATTANRPGQSNPFSSQQWTQGPNGTWQQNTTLNGPLGNAANSLEAQQAAAVAQPFDLGIGDNARNQAITGAYNQATSRLDPQWAQRDELLGSSLANQGLDPNSQAYRTAMQQESQGRNDAYSSAMNGAISQGTAAGAQAFSQGLQARELPGKQLAQLQGLTGQSGFNAAGTAASPDLLGAGMAQDDYALADAKRRTAGITDVIKGGVQAAGSVAALI